MANGDLIYDVDHLTTPIPMKPIPARRPRPRRGGKRARNRADGSTASSKSTEKRHHEVFDDDVLDFNELKTNSDQNAAHKSSENVLLSFPAWWRARRRKFVMVFAFGAWFVVVMKIFCNIIVEYVGLQTRKGFKKTLQRIRDEAERRKEIQNAESSSSNSNMSSTKAKKFMRPKKKSGGANRHRGASTNRNQSSPLVNARKISVHQIHEQFPNNFINDPAGMRGTIDVQEPSTEELERELRQKIRLTNVFLFAATAGARAEGDDDIHIVRDDRDGSIVSNPFDEAREYWQNRFKIKISPKRASRLDYILGRVFPAVAGVLIGFLIRRGQQEAEPVQTGA